MLWLPGDLPTLPTHPVPRQSLPPILPLPPAPASLAELSRQGIQEEVECSRLRQAKAEGGWAHGTVTSGDRMWAGFEARQSGPAPAATFFGSAGAHGESGSDGELPAINWHRVRLPAYKHTKLLAGVLSSRVGVPSLHCCHRSCESLARHKLMQCPAAAPKPCCSAVLRSRAMCGRHRQRGFKRKRVSVHAYLHFPNQTDRAAA